MKRQRPSQPGMRGSGQLGIAREHIIMFRMQSAKKRKCSLCATAHPSKLFIVQLPTLLNDLLLILFFTGICTNPSNLLNIN
jgi:hypothetical protein